ncbi:MAG: Fur family transcriptional regulator [Tepidisphaerales bacterium]
MSDPESYLRSLGLRKTPVRVGVLQVLAKAGRSMSVPQLLGKMPGVDSVTVYRTLNTFVNRGIVHRVRSEDRSWLYALGPAQKSAEHKHPHFVCESCGKVECLAGATIPDDFVRQLGVSKSYLVSYSEVVLHGTCPNCH